MNIIIHLLVLLLCVVIIASCIKTDDYDLPDVLLSEPEIPLENITTFKTIKSLYEQAVNGGNSTVVIQSENDLYIEGFVVSSDKSGNFFEELIIQNKTDGSDPDNDPRLGFCVLVNVSSLSDTFQFGQKVYVKMNGLTIGETSGTICIGKGDAAKLEQIQASEFKAIILRSHEVSAITPKLVSLENLTKNDQNTLIRLENMQLNRFELGATFASESFDEFDGFRVLESCDSGISMMMQTSTYSDFKSLIVPQENGSVTGVYSRDYGDDFNVLIVNSSTDVAFDNPNRCDPLELDCGLSETYGTGNVLLEEFESQKNNKPVEIHGWTNHIEAGTQAWEGYSSTSSNASLGRSARFQSASSGDVSNIGWLITPSINLDEHEGETLRFKTSNSLADSSFMEVLYSQNWDGTEAGVTQATWGVLSAAYVVKDSDSFVPWFNSGVVDLSCETGTMHIAFKYTGGGQESFDGVYELDDIRIDYVE
ncbi:choice-of-anchor J domain-containing protein [Tamlana agarivorans]|uniref:Choice-of-anchor J domain-containing protein n=1 Tax=Pseudotamlana agarivorans TaxID=481183 RepID=A0ACC5U8I6_9FLAO|nr:choice-of-anchor J domain-containing protein [Tamlana agarivorans]